MKKLITVLFSFLLLTVFPAISRAVCSGGVCSDVKIQEMQVNTDGVVFIQTTGTESNLDCTPEANVFLKLDASTAGGKNVFSSLLSYQIADKSLNVRLDPATMVVCDIVYVTLK